MVSVGLITVHFASGSISVDTIWTASVLVPAVLAATWAGAGVGAGIPRAAFAALAEALLILLGLYVMLSALVG